MMISEPKVPGQRYEATVPDTLDLAERALLAINVLTRAVVPQRHYALWQVMTLDSNPPHFAWANWLTFKWLEALPRMRAMSGAEQNLDIERAMMQAFVDRIGSHGLLYYPPISPDQPPNTAYPIGCARFMLAMAAWHDRDGDSIWVERMRAMAHGLHHVAIRHHNYAYYPLESGYAEDGGWTFTRRGGGQADYFPYTPPDEPAREQQGHEGTVKFEAGTTIRALVKTYGLTGDERPLELAGQLGLFCQLPTMWEDANHLDVVDHEHGVFAGHTHGNTMALRGLLDLAVATADGKLKGIVQEAYEHSCRTGVRRVGWLPGWITPERFGRIGDVGAWLRRVSESCALGNMVALAVDLSDAGVGDYWDDVDHFIRNQLVEQQLVDVDQMRAIAQWASANKPTQENLQTDPQDAWAKDIENVVERMAGGFGMGSPARLERPEAYGCCTGNGSLGLYYAWEAVIRYRDGLATVNLPLNRASPWVDVDSFLPFEGRVRVTVKTAEAVALRIPGWAAMARVQASLDGNAVSPMRVGRYLVVTGLAPGQVFEVQFEVPEEEVSYIAHGYRYAFTVRGSTVVDVSPRQEAPGVYSLYNRQQMRRDVAPLKQVTRFVAAG